MTPAERHSNAEWDALFDFVAQEVVEMSADEVRADLRSHRVGVESAVERVKQAIVAARARRALQQAPERRRRLLERMRGLVSQPVEEAREHLRSVLLTLGTSQVQEVYFNRIESAATDEDIRSLVEDISALDVFEDEDTNGGKEA